VTLKAAEETPGTALAIANTLSDAGVPQNVLQILFGRGSSVLLASTAVRLMYFTGSTLVGKELARMATQHLIR
jgi:succinate-semialdehyde dehydrogenase/glutarate-semialdehyde dehydrogenase